MIHETVDCRTLVELVTEWLEGQLPDPTRSDFELHVATCAGCVAYVEQMRLTTLALSRLDSIETTPQADDRTRGELLAIFRARHG
jgi:anti-sigma factor RsiW